MKRFITTLLALTIFPIVAQAENETLCLDEGTKLATVIGKSHKHPDVVCLHTWVDEQGKPHINCNLFDKNRWYRIVFAAVFEDHDCDSANVSISKKQPYDDGGG